MGANDGLMEGIRFDFTSLSDLHLTNQCRSCHILCECAQCLSDRFRQHGYYVAVKIDGGPSLCEPQRKFGHFAEVGGWVSNRHR